MVITVVVAFVLIMLAPCVMIMLMQNCFSLPQPFRRAGVVLTLAIGTLFVTAPMAIASNRIIQAEGGVQIKRRGWTEFRTAEVGSVLHPGDLVHPPRGASVIVLCENSNRWRVPSGVPSGVSNGCPAQRSIGLVSSLRGDQNADRLGLLLGQNTSQVPYIIGPRRSWVLGGQPRLQWHPVEGASSYTVQVVGAGVDWSTQVTDAFTSYSGAEPLQPGETYMVVVQANTGASSQQEVMGDLRTQLQQDERDLAFVVDETRDGVPISGLGFSVLSPDESAILTQERDRILAQSLLPEAQALALSDFYIRFRLIADAIETLENFTQDQPGSAVVYQTLGNLYQHIGLLQEAETSYQQAIARSIQTGDAEAQVIAHIALAALYAQTDRPTLAEALLTEALPSYQQMESSQRQLEFTREIGKVYGLLNQPAIADQWLNQALTGFQTLLGLAQAQPSTPDTSTELDTLEQQIIEIEYLLSTLGAG